VARAADLADEVGYQESTLAALAARLGVAVPSLYKHVDGLDALRRDVAVLATRELGAWLADALASSPERTGSARLRVLAHAYRRWALAHPGRYAATVRAARPEETELAAASESVLVTVLAVLAERGLRGREAIDAARTLRAALHGFVTLEANGGFGLPRDVQASFERMLDWLDRGLRP
jgi:AcrR family transcriptional regulator